jgi:hypothetical protein
VGGAEAHVRREGPLSPPQRPSRGEGHLSVNN